MNVCNCPTNKTLSVLFCLSLFSLTQQPKRCQQCRLSKFVQTQFSQSTKHFGVSDVCNITH